MHTEIDMTRWIIASGVLILLLILFSNALKFYMNGTPTQKRGGKKRRLKLVETLYLDPKNRVTIVQFDKTEMIIGISPSGMEVIGSQDSDLPVEDVVSLCQPDRMEGIGFLKRFIKSSCPAPIPEPTPQKVKAKTKAKPKKADKK